MSAVATLLLMPAWSKDWAGLKTVVFKSDNAAMGLPTIQASYLLIEQKTGAAVAMMDGGEITRRRTAAASALAADYLARKDASTMTMVGAGALARAFRAGARRPCGPFPASSSTAARQPRRKSSRPSLARSRLRSKVR